MNNLLSSQAINTDNLSADEHVALNFSPECTLDLTLSRPISAWKVFSITVVKSLTLIRRYIPNLIGRLLVISIRILFFLGISKMIAFDRSELTGVEMAGDNIFIFLLGGLLLFVFSQTVLEAPVKAVTDDLYNGTLEYLYITPISRQGYLMGNIAAESLVGLVIFLPVLCTLIYVGNVNLYNLSMLLCVCVVSLLTLMAFGIMLSLLALMWRQVTALITVLNIAFELLAGAYFPITAFPKIIQYLAYLLPFTWGFDLVRYYSFDGAWITIQPVYIEWLILACFGVFYTLLSMYLLKRVERSVKQKGLHLL
jgi:ABC-2 type transport system permease protein